MVERDEEEVTTSAHIHILVLQTLFGAFYCFQLQTSSFQALCCCLVTVAIETRHTAAEAGVGTTVTVLMEFDHMV